MPKPFSLSVAHQDGFLLLVATGRPLPGDLMGAIDYAAAIARTHGDKQALFDLLASTGTLTGEEQGALASHADKTLHAFDRVAVVLTSAQPSATSGSTAAAARRVRLFDNLPDAEAWLAERSRK